MYNNRLVLRLRLAGFREIHIHIYKTVRHTIPSNASILVSRLKGAALHP